MIGIGPSSSHTVGPMKAAKRFVDNLKDEISRVKQIKVYLYGSLALTGIGHGTVNAVIYGLLGYEADKLDLEQDYITKITTEKKLLLGKIQNIPFDIEKNVILEKSIFLMMKMTKKYWKKHIFLLVGGLLPVSMKWLKK